MSSYNNGFTVPTLSLSSSRAKKQYNNPAPTRDYSHTLPTSNYPNQNDAYLDNKPTPIISNNPYTQPQKYRRPPIFPPKASLPPKSEVSGQGSIDNAPKDINKKVYLQRMDEYSTAEGERIISERYDQPITQEMRKSTSSKRLLSNPISSRIIEEEVNQRSLNRRADISKVLFDRKLSKLMEEANFYDEEMLSMCKDEISPHLAELEKIKEDNVTIHRDILEGLTALIR